MKAAERQLHIKEIFTSTEFLDCETLCRKFDASESTIRRDLIGMEEQGALRRVHGGAISLLARDETLDLARLGASAQEEKRRIGKAAAALVEDGQTVILGPGTTVLEAARNLFGRRIQVITNSIPTAQVFWDCKNVEVTLTGGYLYPRSGVLMGPICEEGIDHVAADLLILGLAAISQNGLSNSNSLTVGAEKKMIEVSRELIVVADHSKFGRESIARLGPLEIATLVISDSGLAPEYQQMLSRSNVDFRLV